MQSASQSLSVREEMSVVLPIVPVIHISLSEIDLGFFFFSHLGFDVLVVV